MKTFFAMLMAILAGALIITVVYFWMDGEVATARSVRKIESNGQATDTYLKTRKAFAPAGSPQK